MRPLLMAIGIAGLVLGLADYTQAHVGDRVYPIFELTDDDVAMINVKDGSIHVINKELCACCSTHPFSN